MSKFKEGDKVRRVVNGMDTWWENVCTTHNKNPKDYFEVSGLACPGAGFIYIKGLCKDHTDPTQRARFSDDNFEIVILPKTECNPCDDGIKQPNHYMLFDDVEAIEIIARSMTLEQFKGYILGSVLKYRLRAGKKSEMATMEKDLAKAAQFAELFEKHKGLCHA